MLHDLSLHPNQYYILVSETIYPWSQCTVQPHHPAYATLALRLPQVEIISNYTLEEGILIEINCIP